MPSEVPAAPGRPVVDDQQVAAIAKLLSTGRRRRPDLLLGGHSLSAEGIRTAARIAAVVAAEVLAERSPARIERVRRM
ncbi:hypothetical protein ACWDKQ_15725 [Saccharopolyspora sp. NPDC000995]